jgi:hypothetical protein
MVDIKLLIVFACVLGWTVIFSCTNSPRIRPLRNLGIVGQYLVGFVAPFFVGLLPAIVTWLAMGLVGGLIYFLWEIWCYFAEGRKGGDSFPRPISIFHGLVIWPIMIPEAIEYAGAELGILKAEPIDQQESH